uniref:Macaca fascicularis brain cDNA clone: QflA-20047, similar to human seizure related 6 homolog (mouse) (SEZ6), mRNA, RefSeq: NM_178860.2 n=1 Tax=Macaca fascicularis TaxID=9541 RepID=I7GLU5_MACFA|nr:unnamed protein product [Macaca fascicularis]
MRRPPPPPPPPSSPPPSPQSRHQAPVAGISQAQRALWTPLQTSAHPLMLAWTASSTSLSTLAMVWKSRSRISASGKGRQ